MSDNPNLGFGKFVPGFDFLQNLAKGATQSIPQMPNLANWVAPTLNLEELEKRIDDLKAVHFWLDQNSKALGATIQALEVQQLTCQTLQDMNAGMVDWVQKMQEAVTRTPDTAPPGQEKAAAQQEEAPASPAADAPAFADGHASGTQSIPSRVVRLLPLLRRGQAHSCQSRLACAPTSLAVASGQAPTCSREESRIVAQAEHRPSGQLGLGRRRHGAILDELRAGSEVRSQMDEETRVRQGFWRAGCTTKGARPVRGGEAGK